MDRKEAIDRIMREIDILPHHMRSNARYMVNTLDYSSSSNTTIANAGHMALDISEDVAIRFLIGEIAMLRLDIEKLTRLMADK